MGTEITWPDGLVSTVEAGPFSVSPAQVKALSKAGRAWFTATAKRADDWPRRCAVPSKGLGELARAYREAERDPGEWQRRPDRYDAHVAAFRKAQAEVEWTAVWERVKAAYRKPFSWEEEDRSVYLSWHEPEPIPLARNWFAFDEHGKMVLSLTCDRTRALEIAVTYNGAGGRLVLLAPEPVLADAATEDCIAIPDDVPVQGAAPVSDPKAEALAAFGDVVATTGGRIAIMGEGGVSAILADPTDRAETDEKHRDFQVERPGEQVSQVLDAEMREVFAGTPSGLPPARRVKELDVVSFDGHLFQRRYVAAVVKGAKTVRVELSHDGMVLRVHRPDGLVGVVMTVRP